MNKIPKEHLEFLEFTCELIYKGTPGEWALDSILTEFNKTSSLKLTLDDVRHINSLYKDRFFITNPDRSLFIKCDPKIKEELVNYGSLF